MIGALFLESVEAHGALALASSTASLEASGNRGHSGRLLAMLLKDLAASAARVGDAISAVLLELGQLLASTGRLGLENARLGLRLRLRLGSRFGFGLRLGLGAEPLGATTLESSVAAVNMGLILLGLAFVTTIKHACTDGNHGLGLGAMSDVDLAARHARCGNAISAHVVAGGFALAQGFRLQRNVSNARETRARDSDI